jgi:hypothetical protein
MGLLWSGSAAADQEGNSMVFPEAKTMRVMRCPVQLIFTGAPPPSGLRRAARWGVRIPAIPTVTPRRTTARSGTPRSATRVASLFR